jgi:hypothetical protein
MPIDTRRKGYDKAMTLCKKVNDFYNGEDAVKDAGEEYLPRLSGQSIVDYQNYKSRGFVVPAVKATTNAIIGAIMRKDPVFDPVFSYLKTSIDGAGKNINMFCIDAIRNLLLNGGAGYLVEYSNDAYVVKEYSKGDVINFGDNFIVLQQIYSKQNEKDKYDTVYDYEYLELFIDDDGYYKQNLWRKVAGKYTVVDQAIPTKKGKPLTEIPFVFMHIGDDFHLDSKPILNDLANANCDQYKLSTDLRHGLHWTALPTLFLFGDLSNDDGEEVNVSMGAGVANHIPTTDARVELLEFSGAGLSAIEKAISNTIQTMASIGARMLSDQSGGVKAAETARIELSSETATLMTIVNIVEDALEKILAIIKGWSGVDNGFIELNRDFIDVKLDSQSLLALLQTWQSGAISLNTFLYQLEKGELLPSGVTADDEENRISMGGNLI